MLGLGLLLLLRLGVRLGLLGLLGRGGVMVGVGRRGDRGGGLVLLGGLGVPFLRGRILRSLRHERDDNRIGLDPGSGTQKKVQ